MRQPILLEALYISLRASWSKVSSVRHRSGLTLKMDWMLLYAQPGTVSCTLRQSQVMVQPWAGGRRQAGCSAEV